jgi:hypothetical protein
MDQKSVSAKQPVSVTNCPSTHKMSDIKQVAAEFYAANVDVSVITSEITRHKEMLQNLEMKWISFVDRIKETELEISEKADRMKRLIDCHKHKLLQDLTAKHKKTFKELQKARQEFKQHLAILNRLKKYTEEMQAKETASGRVDGSLSQRAKDLLEYNILKHVKVDVQHTVFMPSDLMTADRDNNVVGQLILLEQYKGKFFLSKHILLAKLL